MPSRPRPGWVVSCEHAGREVPPRYRWLFEGHEGLLASHRGWDRGAAPLARALGTGLGRVPLLHRTTRLLVDVNRSPANRRCLSPLSRALPAEECRRLLERVHAPHRLRVAAAVDAEIARHGACVHLAVHTFTPSLDGIERAAEIGLLYDPGRTWERELCARWRSILARAVERSPDGRGWRIRRNYPYRGVSDGLTATLRGVLPDHVYAGIELEVSQSLLGTPAAVRRVARALVDGLAALGEAAGDTRPTTNGPSSSGDRRAPGPGRPSPRR